jgi:acyl-homoserine-lactone acylase
VKAVTFRTMPSSVRQLHAASLCLVTLLVLAACAPRGGGGADAARLKERARNVTITRDDWGIAHVRGATDADVVFGMIYAQAEDDFNRVEVNYLNALGWMAQADGETAIWTDLRARLFIDPDTLQALYAQSPPELKALMDAWADGLNYFLATHPDVKPKVLTRFEPWMALSFTEGSIGTDIESISARELQDFYGRAVPEELAVESSDDPLEFGGSNGIAIAPSNTATGRTLFLINPHTSFFFRDELHLTSDEGLDAYGAATWGQFFLYQGFNARLGWMHTSSGVDAIDEYAETIVEREGKRFYKYGTEERPVTIDTITVPYKAERGTAERRFTVFRTHHGPVVREAGGKWITVRLMNTPVQALTQSYGRMKARNFTEFRRLMDLHTNSSNNTVFASADGDIAYFHANFIPKRDPSFDWQKPVDGSDPRTEWGPPLGVEESPFVHNPPTGWVQNTNNWPYSAAGPHSPKRADFPAYVDYYEENPRGVHAVQLLQGRKDWTLDGLVAAAYDSYQPGLAKLIPALVQAYDRLPASDPRKVPLREPVDSLRKWDLRWSATSVPTSVALYWGEEIWRRSRADAASENLSVYDYLERKSSPGMKLDALTAAVARLTNDFGRWQVPWGEINRFQRLTGDILQPFSDSAPSVAVPFPSARWGSLASFDGRSGAATRKLYGTYGNSFVAVVEFGDSVRARAITAGGISGNPHSPHFADQVERYAAGDLRPVYFYPHQLEGHTERQYHPGE